jgi:nucleotide-binding universal stress UspA family protein
MFWTGLVTGLGIGVLALLIFLLSHHISRGQWDGEATYAKILVASVQNPFTKRSLNTAVRMSDRGGIIETLYVIEIGMERPLDVVADDEVANALQALEDASYEGRRRGKRLLPRLEKARMGSKVILDIQHREGAMANTMRKIVQYVREKASCTVIVLSGKEER